MGSGALTLYGKSIVQTTNIFETGSAVWSGGENRSGKLG